MPDSEAFKEQPPTTQSGGGGWPAWSPSPHSRDKEARGQHLPTHVLQLMAPSAFPRRHQHGVSCARLTAIHPRELQLGPGAPVHTPMATPVAFIKVRGTVGFSQSLLSTLTWEKILEKT